MVYHLRHFTAFATTTDHTHPNGIPHHLDLSYITPRFMVASYPVEGRFYSLVRNNIDELVDYLYKAHGSNWKFFNFRGEKNLYDITNMRLRGKFEYIPLTDHIAPSFQMILNITQKFQQFLQENDENIVVMHCKFGKGRSGLLTVAYLVIVENMDLKQATDLFTEKRMQPGFGPGVCITSQKRYLDYCTIYRDSGISYSPFKIRIKEIRITKLSGLDCVVQLENYEGTHNNKVNLDLLVDKSYADRKVTYIHVLPYDKDLHVMDLRLVIYKPFMLANFFSYATVGFNVFWEAYKRDMLEMANDDCTISFNWEQFDGYLGSYKRGFKIFDKVDFIYERV
ncbi:hypothetical protein WICPIJ_002721 [Wickerhamomyces pijperi]|uniref:phosphatidylinositol-3,4,5-trisphosphate 3-phosphatase n=1 Tax=Wickerhamomyces pijperi TaxID=599730 RepID=A0A9P8TPM2_WICPI|nr:hypothetical protein WICPIJ_002721 [Wickerhamomyces pijperi]